MSGGHTDKPPPAGRVGGLAGSPRGSRLRSDAERNRIRRPTMTRSVSPTAERKKHEEVQRQGRRLGWLSLGLGVAQLAAPHTVRRISGVDDSAKSRAVVPVVGVREL